MFSPLRDAMRARAHLAAFASLLCAGCTEPVVRPADGEAIEHAVAEADRRSKEAREAKAAEDRNGQP